MKFFEVDVDDAISRDFSHLTFAICMHQEPIPKELLGILQRSVTDLDYKRASVENLIAYAATESVIRDGLKRIIDDKSDIYSRIKPLADEILKCSASLETTKAIKN